MFPRLCQRLSVADVSQIASLPSKVGWEMLMSKEGGLGGYHFPQKIMILAFKICINTIYIYIYINTYLYTYMYNNIIVGGILNQ